MPKFLPMANGYCKGVRCPPIFSLSNLIAGTNRKAYLLHASFALKGPPKLGVGVILGVGAKTFGRKVFPP